MARNKKNPKKLIYVFCEGESEIEYINFMKNHFKKVVILKPEKGLFEYAQAQFKNNPKMKDQVDIIDELWFFFDVEQVDQNKWENWKTIINSLNRKNKNIHVRLLMTTACVEYWFLLHYQKTTPQIQSKSDKNKIMESLCKIVPTYKKGDQTSIYEIANNYTTAIDNGRWTLKMLPSSTYCENDDEMIRNEALFACNQPFTTVHEAILSIHDLDIY